MNLLGFYIGKHDSNVAVSLDGEVRYAKSERLTGIKHHRADLSFVRQMCERWGVGRLDAVAFSDGDRNQLGRCEISELFREAAPLPAWPGLPTFCLDHHYAHILSAWPVVRMEEVEVGIAIDGRGDNQVKTRVVAAPGTPRAASVYHTQGRSFGALLERIGACMGLPGNSIDFAGKIMGAQAYGTPDREFIDALDAEAVGERVYDLIFKIPWRGTPPAETADFFRFANASFRDWLASVHQLMGQYLLGFFERFCRPSQCVVFSGGCAQNTVYNEMLVRRFPRLRIPPHCYDGGLSLGCLEFLRLHYRQPACSTRGFPFWQDDCEWSEPSDGTIRRVAELLGRGLIVGWYQGRGEVGPRALGHRSILMDPRRRDGKQVLNAKVKHREHWRPYAPSVLEPFASEFFELGPPSPYMLRAVAVRDAYRDALPAVVHLDNTSRVQTVGEEGDGPFLRLLREFQAGTGVPALLNTSLNGGGRPIFASAEQCLELFGASHMDALCVGNRLYVK